MTLPTPIELRRSGLLEGTMLHKICDLILAGRCVVLPTDTGYMMAVNALDENAVRRLYNAKQRLLSNPMHVAVASVRQAERYAHFSQSAFRLTDRFLPGPLTIILPKKDGISDLLVANTGNLGVRMPDTPLILQICAALELPLTATSTNLAAHPPLDDPFEIVRTFVDYVAAIVSKPSGCEFLPCSTTVRVNGELIEVLRTGPISEDAVHAAASEMAYTDVNDWT